MVRNALLAGLFALVAVPVSAQTGTVVPGGVELSFGFSQRFEADDNLPLALTSPGTAYQSVTRLSFALKSETPNDRIALNASTVVRGAFGKGVANTGVKVDDPRFDLAYSHDAGNSTFSVAANYRRSDLQFLRPLSDFIDANGVLVLPTDLADLFGTGFRTDYGLNGALNFGANGPFGVGFTVGLTGLNYDKVTNPSLVDSRNETIGTNVRLRLNDVTDATVNLGFGRFQNLAASTSSTSRTLSAGLTRAMVYGTASANLTARNSGNGTRLSLDLKRSLTLPSGGLSIGFGATKLGGSPTSMTGSIDWSQQLPAATISVRVSRAIAYTLTNTEQLQTSLSLGYNQSLSSISGLSVSVAYALADPTGVNNNTKNTNLSASYYRSMTPDWNLNVGYSYTLRDRDTVGKSKSNQVFLGLQRTFNIRP